MKNIRSTLFYSVLFICIFPFIASAQEDEFSQIFGGDEEIISLVTGRSQPISHAPAVASVITASDIERMGAINLDQVLETVPGLHVSLSSLRFTPIYSIRGIHTDSNPHVLMLINGVPITQAFQGDRGGYSTLPISNIERIEIIRGPGSAVYGADAFSGVINVITKQANNVNGTEFGVRGGSFNSKSFWVLHSNQWAGHDVVVNLEWNKNGDDYDRTITSDAQTIFDNSPIGTDVSFASGTSSSSRYANTRAERIDAHIELSRGNWRYHLWNWRQIDMGVGPGLAQALDPSGQADVDNYLANVHYENRLLDQWKLRADLSYMDVNTQSKQKLFPPGAVLPIDGNGNVNPAVMTVVAFPDGLIGNPEIYEEHLRLDTSFYYEGDNHDVRIGVGAVRTELSAKESKNFGPGVAVGTLTDVTGTPNIYIDDKSRNLHYLSLQDEYKFAPDWRLTAGVRYDNYSDIGNTVNPRAALVWETRHDLTSKLLYGRAFRAPSFQELFNKNNPILIGNSNLEPETIQTLELAFNYNINLNTRLDLNIFHYDIDDLIEFVTPTASGLQAANVGEQEGDGFELEVSWKASENLNLNANYAFQDAKNKKTNTDAANSPQQQLYFLAIWEAAPTWVLSSQLNYISDRNRAAGDTRENIDDYVIVDLTLRKEKINRNWELVLMMRNLFDEDAKEPSPVGALGVSIPNDFPLPGRAIYAELQYRQ